MKELSELALTSKEFAETVQKAPLRNTVTEVPSPVKWRSLFQSALALRLSRKAPLKEVADLAERGDLTYLEWLSLENHNMDDPAFPELVAAFPNLSHLTSLNLTNTHFKESSDCAALLNATSPSLTSLSLWGTRGFEFKDLVGVLPRFRHLQHLNVSLNYGNGILSDSMIGVLASFNELRELEINGNWIGPEGAVALSHIVTHMPRLRVLKAGFNKMGKKARPGDGGIETLMAALRTCPDLEHLDLKENDFGDVGILSLSPYLSEYKALKYLNLSSNRIVDRDTPDPEDDTLKSPLQVLVESLPLSLETLYLLETNINEAGIAAFLKKLPHMKHLKRLDLRIGPSPGKEAIKEKAAEVLPSCKVVL